MSRESELTYQELVRTIEAREEMSPKQIEILERWKYAHKTMNDDFLIGMPLEDKIMEKFGVSRSTARKDILDSNSYFLTEDKIDKDLWRGRLAFWQLKGIALAYKNDNMRDFNSGIKNLYLIMGLDRKDTKLDPKLFQQNIYNFFSDPRRVGIKAVTEPEVLELIDEIEGISPSERERLIQEADGYPENE
jgi:hypothetical protein